MARPVSLKRLYPPFGQFMIQYAVVQGALRTLLLALLKVRGKGATHLVHGMSDDNVIRKLNVALNAYGRHYPKFKPALTALAEVTAYRNQMVHWVPFLNPSRTTLSSFMDAYRDYRNPNQPEVTCTPEVLRELTKWLRVLEWDVLALIMAIDARERFEIKSYRTLDEAWQPVVPKSKYRTKT